MLSVFILKKLSVKDAPIMDATFAAIGWDKPEAQYHRYFTEQEDGSREVIVAWVAEAFAGYGNVVWQSDYPPFRQAGIPEIQDLNVLPSFRRQGVASAILDEAEARIAARSSTAGIGVGLYTDYGPAQRLYVQRGYIPDARGITHHNQFVAGGQTVAADDELVLWLTKRLRRCD